MTTLPRNLTLSDKVDQSAKRQALCLIGYIRGSERKLSHEVGTVLRHTQTDPPTRCLSNSGITVMCYRYDVSSSTLFPPPLYRQGSHPTSLVRAVQAILTLQPPSSPAQTARCLYFSNRELAFQCKIMISYFRIAVFAGYLMFTSTAVDYLRNNSNVIIESVGPVRLVTGSWTVVLHLRKPRFPDFSRWVETFENDIKRQGSTGVNAFGYTMKSPDWSKRLRAITSVNNQLRASVATLDSPPRRTRRALLSFLGRGIGRNLFGLAMDSDVSQITAHLKRAEHNQRAIHHQVEHYVTIINTMRRCWRLGPDLEDVFYVHRIWAL